MNRLAALAPMSATVAMLAFSPVASSHPACGSVKSPIGSESVHVLHGTTSCAHARKVFRDFFAGRGKRHQAQDEASSYTTVDGWRCNSGAGGTACSRRHSLIQADTYQ